MTHDPEEGIVIATNATYKPNQVILYAGRRLRVVRSLTREQFDQRRLANAFVRALKGRRREDWCQIVESENETVWSKSASKPWLTGDIRPECTNYYEVENI